MTGLEYGPSLYIVLYSLRGTRTCKAASPHGKVRRSLYCVNLW